ncbi:hypothetical protein SAMN05444747_12029 [Variovorax sp. OV329]|nr:hypothetical protein SAMN05444747_12029 [Variovorax sp. OV329]
MSERAPTSHPPVRSEEMGGPAGAGFSPPAA